MLSLQIWQFQVPKTTCAPVLFPVPSRVLLLSAGSGVVLGGHFPSWFCRKLICWVPLSKSVTVCGLQFSHLYKEGLGPDQRFSHSRECIQSLGVGEWGDQPLRCLFYILGFWVRFPLKQGSVATNLFETHWAGRLGKPFTRADILFLPATKHWVSG